MAQTRRTMTMKEVNMSKTTMLNLFFNTPFLIMFTMAIMVWVVFSSDDFTVEWKMTWMIMFLGIAVYSFKWYLSTPIKLYYRRKHGTN